MKQRAGSKRGLFCGLCLVVCVLVAGGCVERTVRVTTQPPGAVVIINDEEVGVSPTSFSFLWYGDYDIMLRKPGYQTLKTHYRVDPPWYQYPPFDVVAETLVATTIRDEHVLPTFELQPVDETPVGDVVQRAVELRERALFQGE